MSIEPPPLLGKVEAALKLISNGKPPGMDNLPADLIKKWRIWFLKSHFNTISNNLENL